MGGLIMSKEADVILRVENIVKEYPGVIALDDVSMGFRKGEVHAIMGENGAGKSTLIKVISGAIQPDSGKIFVDEKLVEKMSTRQSMDLGIAVIYQELMMIPALTAAENVFLGSSVKSHNMVDHNEMKRRAKDIFNQLGVNIDPGARVDSLSVAYRQMIEIARALVKKVRVLIMDEPSAMLTEDEVQIMFNTVNRLKENGVTIIYISHRLEEVFQISDTISIMRDGKFIIDLQTDKTNKAELIHYMVGRELSDTFPERNYEIGAPGIEVRHFTGNGDTDISFTAHHSEILGIGGLVGAGRTELAHLIFGSVKKESGELYLDGKLVNITHPKEAVKHRLGLIPEDRKGQGLLLDFDLTTNVSLPSLKSLSKALVVNGREEIKEAEEMRKELQIKTPSMKQRAKNLSGGNQQKVVLAKWLAAKCDYLIFDEPTRGSLAAQGKCIIMISSEMEELMGISDRIIILCEGKKIGELEKEDFSQDRILAMASGEKG